MVRGRGERPVCRLFPAADSHPLERNPRRCPGERPGRTERATRLVGNLTSTEPTRIARRSTARWQPCAASDCGDVSSAGPYEPPSQPDDDGPPNGLTLDQAIRRLLAESSGSPGQGVRYSASRGGRAHRGTVRQSGLLRGRPACPVWRLLAPASRRPATVRRERLVSTGPLS